MDSDVLSVTLPGALRNWPRLLARFTASMKHLYNGAVITAGPPPKAPTTGDG